MATKQTASSDVRVAVALPAALEDIAHQVAGALQETASLSETLGELTRDAGKLIAKKPELLDPFIDACKQLCGAVGLTEGSFKVYLSNIRGVLRAMVSPEIAYAPKAGQTLRSMYESVPKGTGRQKATGARHATDKADVPAGSEKPATGPEKAAVAPSKADTKRDAITALFGHCDDELAAAIEWAKQNEASFVRYVKANIAATKATEGLKMAA